MSRNHPWLCALSVVTLGALLAPATPASAGCRLVAHAENDRWTFTANVAINGDGTPGGGSVTLQYIDRNNRSGLDLGAGSQISVLASDSGRRMSCPTSGTGAVQPIVRSTPTGGYLKFNPVTVGGRRLGAGVDRGEVVLRIVSGRGGAAQVEVYPTSLEIRGTPLQPLVIRFSGGIRIDP